MFKLFKYIKNKDRWLALLCVILVAGQVFLDLKLPDYTKEITLLISQESDVISDYLAAGLKMLLCALASAGLTVIVGYYASGIASDFSFVVREKVFDKVSDFGSGEIKKFSTASLITRTTNDITQIQMVVALGLQMLIKAPGNGRLGNNQDCRKELAVISAYCGGCSSNYGINSYTYGNSSS